MGYINIDKLSAATLESDPFDYVVIPEFLGSETVRKINDTYPKIVQGGSYPIESLSTGMLIKNVIDELNDESFATKSRTESKLSQVHYRYQRRRLYA